MSRLAVLNVVGLCDRHLGEQMPNLQAYAQAHGKATIKPVLPALTCSAQATYLTGKLPTETGIVANGWYDRELAEHHFWKQSNHLVQAPKLWELVRESKPDFTVAKLFWWYNMYADVNWSITPRPMYPADGRKVFDIYTYPMELREQIKGDLGEFPFPAFWGPMAGLPSSAWIADSARWIEEQQQPDLSLVYLPHLDYNLQRLGPHDPAVAEDLRAIDGLVGELLRFYEQRGVQVVVLSEYGISEVSRSVALNRLFRQQGWLTIKPELGRELLDCGASAAFAIADHQIAHVYVNDPAIEGEVRELLASTPGVAQVLSGEAKRTAGLNHHRAGNLIAVAEEDTWFSYYYWEDDGKAPDFARCVDIHRKYGYDPVELFVDPELSFPKGKVALRLLQKKLGQRMLMDVISLNPDLVKGSHGCIPKDKQDWPVMLGPGEMVTGHEFEATAICGILKDFCLR